MSQVATFNETLAAFFKRRPLEWIDGKRLARIAGQYAWRSRVSDLRRAPYSMTIENRQRSGMSVYQTVNARWKRSEYRFVPDSPAELSPEASHGRPEPKPEPSETLRT